ncbi:MAG: hypothetical protein J6B21_04705 [Oscillospiraceae bacterium]|nr:hypothetical protein [Oscillospiraceae bacterium]
MEYYFDADYKQMYLNLFNAVSDAIEQIENKNYGIAANLLKNAQAECEEIFIR